MSRKLELHLRKAISEYDEAKVRLEAAERRTTVALCLAVALFMASSVAGISAIAQLIWR